jgi:hypothetical protein
MIFPTFPGVFEAPMIAIDFALKKEFKFSMIIFVICYL